MIKKILLFSVLLLVLISVLVFGWYRYTNRQYYQNISLSRTISLGVTEKDIIRIMGAPWKTNIDSKNNYTVLVYQTPSIMADNIYFKIHNNSGKVDEIQVSDEIIK